MRAGRVVGLLVAAGIACGLAGLLIAAPEGKAPEGRKVEISVTEKGFEPAAVTVKKGEPVTLVVTRKTDKTCVTEIVIADQKINEKLPLNKAVTLTFTPQKTGEIKYTCGMNMISGVLKVE